MRTCGFAFAAVLAMACAAGAQTEVSFSTQDGGTIHADHYAPGGSRRGHGVVLAHGGRFTKASWERQARALAEAGFDVLAIDFRGRGESRGPAGGGRSDPPYQFDVLAAARYLRAAGMNTVSVVGASFGGTAAADAAIAAKPGEIDRLVLLAAWTDGPSEKLRGRKLFIVARDDTRGDGLVRLVKIQELYENAPEPKKLVVLEGSAHAQFLFDTDQGVRLMRVILDFLSAR